MRHHDVIPSPVGPLLVVTDEGRIVRIAFEAEDHDAVLASLGGSSTPLRLTAARQQLAAYFAGQLRHFSLPLAGSASGFRSEVLLAVAAVPYGRTVTYTELAAATGRPGAVRATGSALGSNPLPIVVPCHRVVRRDGTAGGFLGGPAAKERLLALEAAA